MSAALVEKLITEPLMAQLNKDMLKLSRSTNRGLTAQIVVLTNLNSFSESLKSELGVELTKNQITKVLNTGKRIALTLHKSFRTRNVEAYSGLVESLPKAIAGKNVDTSLGVSIFILDSPRETHIVKKEMLAMAISLATLSTSQARTIDTDSFFKGGNEVMETEITSGLAQYRNKASIPDSMSTYTMNDHIRTFELTNRGLSSDPIKNTKIKHTQVLDIVTGDMTWEYYVAVTLQDGKLNTPRASRVIESSARKYFNTVAPRLAELSHSDSIKNKLEAALVTQLGGPKAGMKVKKTGPKSSGKSGGNSSSKSKKGSGSKTTIRETTPRVRRVAKKSSAFSQTALLRTLNSQINAKVKDNMGTPALNYRTGRFSDSVRIVNVSTTAKGFPSVAYTYLRKPYGYYETSSGSRWASPDRDPRKLIDMSIRDILREQAIGRLYTRRV